MRIIVTGGAGFIGANLLAGLSGSGHEVLAVDRVDPDDQPQPAAGSAGLAEMRQLRADICDAEEMRQVFKEFLPDGVVHLAAETVIGARPENPRQFVRTNVMGTVTLLQVAMEHCEGLDERQREAFRFVHASHEEVHAGFPVAGRIDQPANTRPASLQSIGRISAEAFARAFHDHYGLPVIITRSSPTIGPFQGHRNLVPAVIGAALAGETIRVPANSARNRRWLYVVDHTAGLIKALEDGLPGRTYLLGGSGECANIEIVDMICEHLDALHPREDGRSYREQVTFAENIAGGDAAAARPDEGEALGWQAATPIATALETTLAWYLDNRDWLT